MRSAQELLDELNALDESPRIEAKRAREIGKSLLQTGQLHLPQRRQAEQ